MWFGDAGLGLALHGLLQSHLVWCGLVRSSYTNVIGPDMLKCQISGKNLALHSNKYRMYSIHILLIEGNTETKVENRQSNFLWFIWRRKFDSAPIFCQPVWGIVQDAETPLNLQLCGFNADPVWIVRGHWTMSLTTHMVNLSVLFHHHHHLLGN